MLNVPFLSFPLPVSDIVSNYCLLAGHILALWVQCSAFWMWGEEWGGGGKEEEGRKISCWTDLVLVICHFFITNYRPALIQWSVPDLDKVQALKLQAHCIALHRVDVKKTRLQILLFSWPAITTWLESVLEREHGNELWSASVQVLFLAQIYRANRRTTYQYLHPETGGYILHSPHPGCPPKGTRKWDSLCTQNN